MVVEDDDLTNGMDVDDDINKTTEMSTACLISYISLLDIWISMDHILYNITPEEEKQPQQFIERKELRINDLSNPQAHMMTHFYHDQLVRLHKLFDLSGYLRSINEECVPLYTDNMRDNTPCHYLINPEELFLFTLTKVATGQTNQCIVDEYLDGDYTRWSYGYRWMLIYLDRRYEDIIVHQGLVCFVKDFPRFDRAIE